MYISADILRSRYPQAYARGPQLKFDRKPLRATPALKGLKGDHIMGAKNHNAT
jgi:hypothetical protein